MSTGGVGLDQGEVVVAPYHPGWPEAFATVAAMVRQALGDAAVAVAHVGSTAVPGLVAKPIIDVAVGMASGADVAAVIDALEEAGFLYRGDNGDDGGRLFVLETSPGHRVAHVHAVDHGDLRWQQYLAFRDRL